MDGHEIEAALNTPRRRGDRSGERHAQNEARKDARDIADKMPTIVDVGRRLRCRESFRSFCEEYFPEQFPLAWSEDHLRAIAKIEQSVLHGGLFALAMPRGSGKSTLAEVASLWALVYAHRGFVVLIGADAGSAAQMLDSLKTELETNDDLLDDFPEVCYPIRCLDGIPHRAGGQLFKGERTHIGWTADEIVLPTIEGSKSSGGIIRVAGITGRVRGMKHKRVDGKSVRPDIVVIDDPQTDDSARSMTQSQARVAVLTGAILGLAGPGKKIAGIMPCTVIRPGDMADRILDPKRHPEWNGERTKLMYSFPDNAVLWEQYAKIRGDSLRADGTIRAATEFYAANRDEMDKGARAAWAQRFNPDELSAIQNCMNLKLLDEAAFFAEYQNEPLPDADAQEDEITSDVVVSRLSGLARHAIPPDTTRITAFIDVQKSTLWYCVTAWTDNCDGRVIDYGTFPDQKRAYFTLRDAKLTLAQFAKGAGLEGQIRAGLDALADDLFGRVYITSAGTEMKIELSLVDANWGQSTELVYQFCRESKHAALLVPSHGIGVGAKKMPMAAWPKKPGERSGNNWRITPMRRGLKAVKYDTNSWKSWLAARLLTSPGDLGNFMLYGRDPERHRMIAEHITSEFKVRVSAAGKAGNDGRAVDEWSLRPGRDNHWLDCLVGCAVAASIRGQPAAPPSRETGKRPLASAGARGMGQGQGERKSFAALQREAKARKR